MRTFYKAVHSYDGEYFSNHDYDYVFVVGQVAKPRNEGVPGAGIYSADIKYVFDYCGGLKYDQAVLELQAEDEDIEMRNDGAAILSKAFVVREVPMDEVKKMVEEIENGKPEVETDN